MGKIDFGTHPARNNAVFIIGTIVCAFGTVLSTNTNLGVTPSAALPYVVNLSTGISLGIATFAMQICFFCLSFLLLGKKNYELIYLLTIPTLLIYSISSDVFMVVGKFELDGIGVEWIVILIATAIRAFGISLQLASNMSMNPFDMFINHVSIRFGKGYGATKIAIDVTMVIISTLLSFALLGGLKGVGWGTLFAALATGTIVALFEKLYISCGFYEWVGHIEHEYDR